MLKSPKIPQQLVPLAILFALLIGALVLARQLLVPDTFGDLGHYRAKVVDEIGSQQLAYAGFEACLDCHSDLYQLKQQSRHKGVACEVCHGPAASHVNAPDEYKPNIPKGRGFCPLCHGYNPSRPSGFPQIIPEQHNPGRACMSCHNPHNPLLPHTPEECSACHRDIANVKVVSPHAALPCTRCHTVPEQHRINPKFVRAEKPTSRELCGQCHAQGAESSPEIPRIDLQTHGGRYLCWDCHYPHYPEAHK